MLAKELKETRQKLGLSLKDAARIFKTPERTWRAWETETGQNARRVPGCIEIGLFFYGKLREDGVNFDQFIEDLLNLVAVEYQIPVHVLKRPPE